jgi:hypothetical protein
MGKLRIRGTLDTFSKSACMDMTRHFYAIFTVVFDVRVLDLNLSIVIFPFHCEILGSTWYK